MVSRFLDSIGVPSLRAPFRTLYALDFVIRPKQIHVHAGFGAILTYDKATFFQRLEVEGLGSFNGAGQFLRSDSLFNVDSAFRKSSLIDAVEILTGFDVDDQGYIYPAATIYGWGISKNGGAVYQNADDHAGQVVAFKGASRYYVLTNTGRCYDVTDRAHPVRLPAKVPKPAKMSSFAKSADDSRVAVIDFETHLLTIHAADELANGVAPRFLGVSYAVVTSDGTNFYALRANVVDVIVPSGSGYAVASSFTLDSTLTAINRIHYGDGYLVVTGVDKAWTWRLYSVSNLTLKLMPCDVSATASAQEINALDGVVVGDHLLLGAKSIGTSQPIQGAHVPEPTPPAAPDFSDQQTAAHAFVIRNTQGEAEAHVAALYALGVTHAGFFKQSDGKWQIYWF